MSSKMNSVYVVVENGVPYAAAYVSFELAVLAVKAVHAEEINRQLEDAHGEPICSELDVPENTLTGITHLYVEKGINIEVHKLQVLEAL